MLVISVIVALAVLSNLVAGLVAMAGLGIAVTLAWQGTIRIGRARAVLFAGAGVAVAAVVAELGAFDLIWVLVPVAAGAVVTALAVRIAFGDNGAAGGRWKPVPPPTHPVVLINPHSGDGRAERVGLAEEARRRGIEAVVLSADDDLGELARSAIERGSDALGMAGGDGSMAIVAAIAADRDVAFACIPAGTRNHFALDLGVRREDVAGALDAFTDGVEARVDLASVNGRVFVNNASLGVYAEAVQEPGYREAKLKTLGRTARSTLGPQAAGSSGIRLVDDLGHEHASPALALVSNNPYAVDSSLGRSTRPRIDGGRLGVIVVGDSSGSSRTWEAPELTVDAPGPTAVALDGEALKLEPPLAFEVRPASLRVRISSAHPGVSPSGRLPPKLKVVIPRLIRIARGRAAPEPVAATGRG